MKPSANEMIIVHIPYRLAHLDGLVWACHKLLTQERPQSIRVYLDDQEAVRADSLFVLTNPLVEVGILYCRVLLDFLGIKLNKEENRLMQITGGRPYPDDFGIEHLDLPRLTVAQLLQAPVGSKEEIEQSIVATLRSADKGVAHFTTGHTGRAYAQNSLTCASAVTWCIEEFVYRRKGISVPQFRKWTAA